MNYSQYFSSKSVISYCLLFIISILRKALPLCLFLSLSYACSLRFNSQAIALYGLSWSTQQEVISPHRYHLLLDISFTGLLEVWGYVVISSLYSLVAPDFQISTQLSHIKYVTVDQEINFSEILITWQKFTCYSYVPQFHKGNMEFKNHHKSTPKPTQVPNSISTFEQNDLQTTC